MKLKVTMEVEVTVPDNEPIGLVWADLIEYADLALEMAAKGNAAKTELRNAAGTARATIERKIAYSDTITDSVAAVHT